MELKIYYDDDCGICKKGAKLLTYFALPVDTLILPGQSDSEVLSIMSEQNSWLVISKSGESYFGFAGVIEVLRNTKYLWPMAYLLAVQPIPWLGEKIYKLIASNRGNSCTIGFKH